MPYIGKKPENIIATAVDSTTGTFSGAVSAASVDADGGVTVDNITIDGQEIDVSSGDLTLDVAGDIILDADGGEIIIKDGGTENNRFIIGGNDAILKSSISNGDMIFKGNDDGSEITALTLDMSAAGDATFNNNVTVASMFVAGNITHAGDNDTQISFTDNEITLDSGGDIVLDADGADILLKHDGTHWGSIYTNATPNNLYIQSMISDGDIYLSGNDGGSAINALQLDMSTGGQLLANPLGVTVPSYAFQGDVDTGMTRPTGDTLQLITGGSERLRIGSAGRLSTGAEASPDANPGGITLHGGSISNPNMITFKQSNTAHGITDLQQTDTQGTIGGLGDNGGLYIQGYSESTAAVYIVGHTTSGDTTKSTLGQAACRFQGRNKSGTNVAPLTNHNIFGVYDSSANARVLIDQEGDIFHDGSLTAYDSYDDAQLVRAFDQTMASKSIIHSKFDDFVKYNKKDLEEAGLLGTCTPEEEAEGHRGLVSLTGMQRLHNGAIWQQYEKHQNLVSAFYKLAKKTIGIEEADKLLTQEEIQLLN